MTRGYVNNVDKWFYTSGIVSVLLSSVMLYCWLQLVSVSAQISATTAWHKGDAFYSKFVFWGWLFSSFFLLFGGFLLITFANIQKEKLMVVVNVIYVFAIFGGVLFVESCLRKHMRLPSSVDIVVVLLCALVIVWCFVCLLVDMNIYRKAVVCGKFRLCR